MKLGKEKLNIKDIYKRVDYQLRSNYLSIKDLEAMTSRQIKKFIKQISKIENVKLSKLDLNDFVEMIASSFKVINDGIKKLWSFIRKVNEKITTKFSFFTAFFVKFLPSYRVGKFELMLN